MTTRTRALLIAAAQLALTGAATAQSGAPDTLPTRFPAAPRVVAFGDVHGDLNAARRALRLAGAIDEQDRWIGGRLVVVQTGDQLDRGDDERAILRLFDRLTYEAAAAGGAFHALNGNHELMNALLDLRYVTEGGFADFRDVGAATHTADSALLAYHAEQRGRIAAFRPGGEYARLLAKRNTMVVVGDNVFVHGGVLPPHAAYGIDRINREIRAWLHGYAEPPSWVRGSDSPTWTRLYSQAPTAEACDTAAEMLRLVGARRIIVGHTVHREGVTAYCDGRVWAIDVGLAAYYRGPMEVLEIRGDTLTPIRAGGR
jgi:hypothetical protein